MRLYFSIILMMSSLTIFAQADSKESKNDVQIIQSFIHDLADHDVALDVILSQYLIVDQPSEELYDYLEASLEEVRINLMTKNTDEIRYVPYAQMSRRDVRDIDPEGLNPDQMYFLHYRNRQMLAVYVAEGKIGSFTLVSKGQNKAHFVLY